MVAGIRAGAQDVHARFGTGLAGFVTVAWNDAAIMARESQAEGGK